MPFVSSFFICLVMYLCRYVFLSFAIAFSLYLFRSLFIGLFLYVCMYVFISLCSYFCM